MLDSYDTGDDVIHEAQEASMEISDAEGVDPS